MAGISKKRIKTKKGEITRYFVTYRDIFGKQHTSGYYETIKEAKKHLKEFETPKADNSITYGQIFREFLDKTKTKSAFNTFDNYNRYYNQHFKQFDTFKYDKINSLMWQKIFDDIESKSSPYITEGCLKFAKAAVNYFIKHGLIEFNVFNRVEKVKIPKPDINHLTIEEIKRVLDECRRSFKEYYALLYTFIGTGAREGEIFALEKTDFCPDENCISITKQYTKGKLLQHPKTEHSNRKIYIFEDLKEVLIEHIKTLDKDNPLLFPSNAGTYLRGENLRRRVFYKLLELCGINKRVRLHDLRGSYTDMTLSSGLSVKFTQNQLGHAKSDTTLNIYARNNTDMIELATSHLNSIFKKCETNVSQKENEPKNKIIPFRKKQSGIRF